MASVFIAEALFLTVRKYQREEKQPDQSSIGIVISHRYTDQSSIGIVTSLCSLHRMVSFRHDLRHVQ